MNPIKTFREYRGLTQAKLAKLTNLSVVMIKKLESGETKGSLKSLKNGDLLNIDFYDGKIDTKVVKEESINSKN